jgi:hypothetical protein
MRPADKIAYDELVEVAARCLAFTDITAVPLSKLVTTLQVEAVDLRGGWEGFDENAPPGSQNLPIADQVADEVFRRANELRREFVEHIGRAVALQELHTGTVRH